MIVDITRIVDCCLQSLGNGADGGGGGDSDSDGVDGKDRENGVMVNQWRSKVNEYWEKLEEANAAVAESNSLVDW